MNAMTELGLVTMPDPKAIEALGRFLRSRYKGSLEYVPRQREEYAPRPQPTLVGYVRCRETKKAIQEALLALREWRDREPGRKLFVCAPPCPAEDIPDRQAPLKELAGVLLSQLREDQASRAAKRIDELEASLSQTFGDEGVRRFRAQLEQGRSPGEAFWAAAACSSPPEVKSELCGM